MSVLLQRLFLAVSLAAMPAFAFAASDTEEKTEEAAAETSAEKKSEDDAADDEAADAESGDDEKTGEEAADSVDDEWAEKLKKRQHEGDVALGVCGARMTALMWFYQASVADGRDDLEPAYDSIKESRTVLKTEAERRAVEDGIGTSVSVMNEYSAELWEELVTASEEPETFQKVHDTLFANVQECLSMFFKRGKRVTKAEDADTSKEAGAEDEKEAEEKAD